MRGINLRLQVLLALIPISVLGAGIEPDPQSRSSSLQNNVLFGYQGWFSTSNSDVGWIHWSNGATPAADTVTFDLFPDVSEFIGSDSLDYATLLTDKSTNETKPLYDAVAVVDTHFAWMQNYGINGVVLQRFVSELSNEQLLARRNEMLLACMAAAEKYERVFMIEYDTSGASMDTWAEDILADWRYLVDTLDITSSQAYQHELGKPVVFVFGVGFTDHPGTAEEALSFVTTMQTLNNVWYVGHVPTYWRDGGGDGQDGFSAVYAAMDTISPWLVGRFSTEEEFDSMFRQVFEDDIELTTSRGQGYAPNVWPGFSWTNVQRIYGSDYPLNQIPRNGGAFWSHQMSAFVRDLSSSWRTGGQGPQMVFGAMFDEFDESTAMAKAVSLESDLPREGTFLYLSIDCNCSTAQQGAIGDGECETIPSDFYLTLAGQYTTELNNQQKVAERIERFGKTVHSAVGSSRGGSSSTSRSLDDLKRHAAEFERLRTRTRVQKRRRYVD